jgi:hypothetical protein
MPSLIVRLVGLLSLWGSYYCFRWAVTVWQWVQTNGHTEGSPAGLGIFAIGAGIDFVLLIIGVMLAILGGLGVFAPRKAFVGRDKRSE